MTGQKLIIHPCCEQTFENYFVCEENQIACAAARSVARTPGKQFNPFFIYGCSDTGKTHLLKAISHELKITRPELKVIYTITEEFIVKHINSIRNNNPDELYSSYHESDILLIDEFESIYNKPDTQREIINTINSLISENKQVVFSAGNVPEKWSSEIQSFQKKWEWSFITDLSLPGYNSRLAFLHYLSERSNITYPEESLNYMAKILISGFGVISSVFRKTEMVSELSGEPVTIEIIKPLLKEFNI